MTGRRTTKAKRKRHGKELAAVRLDSMVEEAIVDACGESEQRAGFFTTPNDNLAMPFRAEVLGVEDTVDRIDMTEDEKIVAVCPKSKSRQRVAILDPPLPNPPPASAGWVEACRRRPR